MVASELEVTVDDLEAFADAWDRHDVDTIMTFFTDDCVFIAGWGERFVGKERVQKGVSEFFSKFPDGHFSDGTHFVSGHRGVSEWTFTATGLDGHELEMTGCDLFQFKDGKIAVKNAFRKEKLSQGGVVSDKPQLTGGCLCGAVRYESTRQPAKVGYCHCRMCQKVSGAPVAVGVYFHCDTFKFVKGSPKYYQSSTNVERGFCDNCGSRLTYRIFDSDWISVEVGSLDHPECTPPEYHIGIESRIPWFEIEDELPRTQIDE